MSGLTTMITTFTTLATHIPSPTLCAGSSGYISNTSCPTIAPFPIVAHKQGYTQQPNTRGTLDILWSCAVTLLLCSWSTVCLHLPGSKESKRRILWRRLVLTALCIVAPELLFSGSYNQWVSAKRSVEAFSDLGYDAWTMTHAYFADAGGFVLKTDDFEPIPLVAEQVYYLYTRGYIDMPKISLKEITDKNKVDTLLRLLTSGQISWFSINVFLRYIQGLHVLTLELTTVAFIYCSSISAVLWWHKPADVAISDIIHAKVSMQAILTDAGRSIEDSYHYTPLDFISHVEWHWSKLWSHWVGILRLLGLGFKHKPGPIDRIGNTRTIPMVGKHYTCIVMVSLIYASIFVTAWNHDFPTKIESHVWRIAALDVLLSMLVYSPMVTCVSVSWPRFREKHLQSWSRYTKVRTWLHEWTPENPFVKTWHRRFMKAVGWCRNNSPQRREVMHIPIKLNLLMYVLGFCYFAGRGTIFLLDLIELRWLPASAYETVNWTVEVFHI